MRISRRNFLVGALSSIPLAVGGCSVLLPETSGLTEMPRANFREIRLGNGFRALIYQDQSGIVSSELLLKYGSMNESVLGLAHLVEHVIANGRKEKYSKAEFEIIKERLQRLDIGISFNWTSLRAGVTQGNLPLLLDFYKQTMFHSLFDPQTIDIEKERVILEGSGVLGREDEEAVLIREMLYGKNNPVVHPRRFDKEAIKEIKQEELKKFYRTGFQPNLMSLILAGTLPRNIEDLVEKTFGDYQCGDGQTIQLPLVGKTTGRKEIRQKIIEGELARIYIGFITGISQTHEDYPLIKALNFFLGDSNGSLLKKVVDREEGLAYSIGASLNSPEDGSAQIEIGAETRKPEETIEGIFRAFDELKQRKVNGRRIQTYQEGELYTHLSDQMAPSNIRDMLGRMVKNDRITPKSSVPLTSENLRRAAREYLPSREEGYVLFRRG